MLGVVFTSTDGGDINDYSKMLKKTQLSLFI